MQKLLVCLCVGQSHGVGEGGGGWGVTWKFSKLGSTHRWLSVGAGGCTYVCTLRTYVRMYVFVIKSQI